jgi:serine/threonine protein kinase
VDPTDSAPAVGTVIAGKYRVEGTLGAGGMGVVVRAHHELLDQKVALKFLLPAALKDKVSVERFLREARAAVKLESEHVARILDLGTLDDGAPYIVMELLDGMDLGDLLQQRGALPVQEAVDYMLEALDAIAEAHARGIVHRDLKPSNLFCARRADGTSTIKVLDFGISKLSVGEEPLTNPALTSSFTVIGSPVYMSPEQFRSSRSVDARGDIWSLGIILYQLLTGRNPFLGNTMGELFTAIITKEPIAPRTIRPDIPPALEGAILRCLRKTPADRYPSSGELAHVLSPFGSGRASRSVKRAQRLESAPPPASMRHTPQPSNRPPPPPREPSVIAPTRAEPSIPPPPVAPAAAAVSTRSEPSLRQLVSSGTSESWTENTTHPKGRTGLVMVLGSIFAILGGLGAAYLVSRWRDVPVPQATTTSSSSQSVVTASSSSFTASSAVPPASSSIDAGPDEQTIDVNSLPPASPRTPGRPPPKGRPRPGVTSGPKASTPTPPPQEPAPPTPDIFDRQ